MKKKVVLTVGSILFILISGIFAEDSLFVELPEPVFQGSAPLAQSGGTRISPVPGISSQEFQELVYLWTLDPHDASEIVSFVPLYTVAAAGSPDAPAIPAALRNNQYYQESLRFHKLAQETFEYGDYDASASYAEEASRYAQLSDDYVALQLRIKTAGDLLAEANTRLTWASGQKAPERYPQEYARAQAAYDEALTGMQHEEWDEAQDAAKQVLAALANVRALNAPPAAGSQPVQVVRNTQTTGGGALPAQYTVRSWVSSRDCLWNIAGRSWAYGDPFKWRILYNANKSRMPDPNDPDLINPGMILDIPSIQGELRSGMWSANTTYTPLQ
ncbi:MAG: hypothetical protein LBD37_01910 [Treponema sp.]|jgi:hypothetical protein|nr:hypothetical protein [Treponema sp.]